MAGGLASGLTIAANTKYYIFALINESKDSVDYGYDTSATAVNLMADENVIAAGYIYYRCIGSCTTNASSKIALGTLNLHDTSYIGAAPGNKYDVITIGASGSTYTAPDNGYINFNLVATAANQYLNLNSSKGWYITGAALATSYNVALMQYVSKGEIITYTYTLAGAKNCKFFYTQAKS
jgi:hypothetical protein